MLSLHALANLFAYKLNHFNPSLFEDQNGIVRIQSCEWSFEKLFEECYSSIWQYGKKDRYIQNCMHQMINQLKHLDTKGRHDRMFTIFLNEVKKEVDKNENSYLP